MQQAQINSDDIWEAPKPALLLETPGDLSFWKLSLSNED